MNPGGQAVMDDGGGQAGVEDDGSNKYLLSHTGCSGSRPLGEGDLYRRYKATDLHTVDAQNITKKNEEQNSRDVKGTEKSQSYMVQYMTQTKREAPNAKNLPLLNENKTIMKHWTMDKPIQII